MKFQDQVKDMLRNNNSAATALAVLCLVLGMAVGGLLA
jgi:hypothetical protein